MNEEFIYARFGPIEGHMFKHFGIHDKLELIGLRNKYKFDHERLRDIEEVENTTKSLLNRVLDRESKLQPFRI
jgi:hypothetical protein